MARLFSVFFMAAAFLMAGLWCGPVGAQDRVITMSTTTSTEASGLLDYLLPEFKKDTGIDVRVMSKGTGAALRDGMDGNADIVFVHDVEREKAFVEEGYGTKRYYVMYNDFIIIGPEEDPAGIRDADNVVEALKIIAGAEEPFVSRGDDSGTHSRELSLWQETALPLNDKGEPEVGSGWYFAIGQGMGASLLFAEEKNGYVLSDRGTYLQYKYGRDIPYDLVIVFEGGEGLMNPYGIIPVNPEMHPHVKYEPARELAEWLVSQRGQEVIGSYQLHGQQLFFPDAK